MKKVIILGAGKIGRMCVHLLQKCGDYEVTCMDSSEANLAWVTKHVSGAKCIKAKFDDAKALDSSFAGQWAVLSCAPFQCNLLIAQKAKAHGVHYLDLTEDVAVTKQVIALAKDASTAFIPQCGLAPGFITIAAWHLAKGFDKIQDLRLRVGALPRFPNNAMKYNLTWSTDGLINEYCQPCEAILEGQFVTVPPLEQLEQMKIDGIDLEAFNTSGGLGSLGETLKGKVRNLNYKTMRFPGHRDILKLLLEDLGFRNHREDLKKIFERALPATDQDQVAIFVSCVGEKDGRLLEKTYAKIVLHKEIDGQPWTAIQITTAAGITAVLDLLKDGAIPAKGFVRNEDVPFEKFIANRFGKHYA
ncbi:MAG: saccharopine dehydrogenase NADP-binding domain-containing protein [Planctomycetes bacterium]|nr:saccharopine dehydrogenase NADP-binding domain-containing protein [Planctomycetota bacterium]